MRIYLRTRQTNLRFFLIQCFRLTLCDNEHISFSPYLNYLFETNSNYFKFWQFESDRRKWSHVSKYHRSEMMNWRSTSRNWPASFLISRLEETSPAYRFDSCIALLKLFYIYFFFYSKRYTLYINLYNNEENSELKEQFRFGMKLKIVDEKFIFSESLNLKIVFPLFL